MKSKWVLIIYFILLSKFTLAQAKIIGKIIDNNTEQGIAYASLVYLYQGDNYGGYTDSLGNFILGRRNADLKISCIGYQTILIKKEDLDKLPTIRLFPFEQELNTIVVRPKKSKIIRLGYFEEKVFKGPFGFGNYNGSEGSRTNYVAQFISCGNKKNKGLLITKLLYNVSNNIKHINNSNLSFSTKCVSNRLRLHLFSVNPKTGKPDLELLTKNIIFLNDCNKDNIVIDISDEEIYMSDNGIFVGIEYVDDLTSANKSYPYYIVLKESKNNCYYSYHQQNWTNSQFSYPYKIAARFGIELSN